MQRTSSRQRAQRACSVIRIPALGLIIAGFMTGGGAVAVAKPAAPPCQSGSAPCRVLVGGSTAPKPYRPGQVRAHVDDMSSARRRPARTRIVVHPRVYPSSLFDEPGVIYGYPPGNYVLGANGILYGPYPLWRSRSHPVE